MSKYKKIPPKLMLTQQTFDTCIYQFFPTGYLVDKWNNQYIDIWWVRILLFKQCIVQKIVQKTSLRYRNIFSQILVKNSIEIQGDILEIFKNLTEIFGQSINNITALRYMDM